MKNESSLRYIKLIPNDYYDIRFDDGIDVKSFLDGEVANAYKSIYFDDDEESITIMLPSNFTTLTPFLRVIRDEDNTQYNYYDLFISIELSEGFQEITAGVFNNWNVLNTITIPSTLKSINCPSGLRVNINNLAAWCNIDFNESNPASNGGSLYLNNVKIENLSIPESVTRISDYAFYGMDSLLSIEILGKDTIFYEHTFSNCNNVESLISYASIPDFAFYANPKLKTVDLYGSSIGEEAFYKNSNLTKVILRNTITSIGEGAFYNCYKLYQVISESTNPDWGLQIDCCCFLNVPNGFRIYVPLNYKNTYINQNPYFSSNSNWFVEGFDGEEQLCPYNDQIWYSNGTDYIAENYTYPLVIINQDITADFKQNTKIWLPDSVITIDSGAFNRFTILENITLPNSITTIKNDAFAYCENLTNVTLPNKLITIEGGAFGSCKNLKSIRIPQSVTSIGNQAFFGCSSLASVTIGNVLGTSNLTSIGHTAFKSCKLSAIIIPLKVTFIGYEAFSNNTNLTKVTCNNTSPSNVSFNTSGKWNAFGSSVSTITVPKRSLSYTTADGWKEYEDKIIKSSF